MSALKPCPFCGGAGVYAAYRADHIVRYHIVRCLSCAAEGPWGKSEASAVGSWNRRIDDARAQRIRDIVAQQWAVAIAVIGCTLTKSDGTPTDPDDYFANVWAKCLTQVQGQIVEWLPSAAEIVGGEP